MDNGRIMKELKELQDGVKNVSQLSTKSWDVVGSCTRRLLRQV
jgi:hypothetical protein